MVTGIVTHHWIKKKKAQNKDVEGSQERTPIEDVEETSTRISIKKIVSGKVTPPQKEEFEKLVGYEDSISERRTISQGQRYNKIGQFNLNPDVLPFDHNRIKLRNPINGCDYVNCSWITKNKDDDDGYDQLIYTTYVPYYNIRFAVGQDPLPNTLQHHYRMIQENKFEFIIGIHEEEAKKPLKVGRTYHFNNTTLQVHNRKKIQRHWSRTEITLFDVTAPGSQYMHHCVCFEFAKWPKEEITSSEETKDLIEGIFIVRKEFNLEKSSLKIFLHDSESGLGGAAVFLSLYDFLQKIDESFNENDELKQSAGSIDVFDTVNALRRDRAYMINNYSTYKLLFYCLEYYGYSRGLLRQLHSKPMPSKSSSRIETVDTKVKRKVVVKQKTGHADRGASNTTNDDTVQYIMDDESDSDSVDPFDEYYMENDTKTPDASFNKDNNIADIFDVYYTEDTKSMQFVEYENV